LDETIFECAASNNHLKILIWAKKKGYHLTNAIYYVAAVRKNLEVLKLLRENRCVNQSEATIQDNLACSGAARGGHLKLLKWTRKNGFAWNKTTCESAAAGGNLKILKWARKNECPWDENTCTEAASTGHLEILKWCKENGCPWNAYTCTGAVFNGNL
jgi:hypothetical protein